MRLIMCTGTKLHAFPLPPNLQSMKVDLVSEGRRKLNWFALILIQWARAKWVMKSFNKIFIEDFRLHQETEMLVEQTKFFFIQKEN